MTIFNKFLSVITAYPRKRLTAQLRKHGLFADDIIVERSDLTEALLRLPAEVLENRNRRIRRAFDLSLKHEELPAHLQNYDPFESYLGEEMAKAAQKRVQLEIIDRA